MIRPARPPGPLRAGFLAVAAILTVAGSATATGPVVEGELSSAAGARAVLRPVIGGFEVGTRVLSGDWPPEPVAEAAVAPDGRFALAAPDVGMWRVVVEAPGRVPMHRLLLPLAGDLLLPPLELTADAGCELLLVDGDGRPVAGARVRADALRGTPRLREIARQHWYPAARRATSGPDGRLRIPAVDGEELEVNGRAAGAIFHRVITVEPPCGQTLRALPAAPAVLEVRSADGGTLAGALVDAGRRLLPVAYSGDDGRARTVLPSDEACPVTVRTEDGLELRTALEPAPAGRVRHLDLPPAIRLSGRVLDRASERPVAGALVWDASDVLHSARSGADGSWSLLVSEPGPARLRAVAAGFVEAGVSRSPGQTAALDLRLRPSVEAHGAVVDGLGRPLAGARLEIEPVDGPPGRPGGTRSTADGSWRIAGLDAEARHRLRAELSGFLPAEVPLSVAALARGETLRVVLDPAAVVQGRLASPAGEPVTGAIVRLAVVATPGTDSPPARLASGRSAADGSFRLDGLAPGRYRLLAGRDGEQPLEVAQAEVPTGGATVDLGTRILGSGGVLEVTVDDPSGRPVEGAEVAARRPGGRDATCLTAARGCSLTGLPPSGQLRVEVRAAGFAAVVVAGVLLPAPEPLAVTLQPGAPAAGWAVDPDDRPLPGASVRLSVTTEPGQGAAATAVRAAIASEDGSFEVDAVPAGRLEARADLEGYLPAEVIDARFDPFAGDPLVLRLRPASAIQGTVFSAGGAPVEDARVTILSGATGAPGAAAGRTASTGSNSRGEFRMDDLSPGPAQISVRHDDYPPLERELEIPPGDSSLVVTLEPGVTISGWVVDPAGGAVPAARVVLELAGPSRSALRATAGDDGSFSFPRVPPGQQRIRAEAEGFAPGEGEPVEVAGEPIAGLEVVLDAGIRILGVVSGLDSTLLPRVQVSALGPWATRRWAQADAGGEFTLDHLPPGQWVLQARLPDDTRRAERRLEIPPGSGDRRVEIEFELGETLRGRLTADGTPVAGAILSLGGLTSRQTLSVHSGPAGDFEAGPLPAGRYRLAVVDPSSALRHVRTVAVGAQPEIAIALSTGEIAGTVVEAGSLQPAAGVSVRLEPAGTAAGLPPSAVTTGDGGFRFRRVVAGDYRLIAERAGHRSLAAPVTVAADTVAGPVELVIEPADG